MPEYKFLDRPSYRKIDQREEQLVAETLQEFSQLTTYRNTHAQDWEDTARLIAPNYRNTFYYGNFNWPGERKTEDQVDATGMMALHRFGAICDSLITPRNQFWHGLAADDDYVMKDHATKLWFEAATKIVFKARYAATANFSANNTVVWEQLGAFGTGPMFVDAFDGTNYNQARGLRYKALPLGEAFLREDHQGIIDGLIRWFRLTARQAYQKWGEERFPGQLGPALKQGSEQKFDFLHRICPRADYDPERLDDRGKPFLSVYVCIPGRCVMQEGGYNSFPLSVSRYMQGPGEVYGRGPAGMVLPALKTLNAQKKVFLKQGHRAADPVLLTADDGILSMNLRPGAINKGGVSTEGKELVKTLPTGRIDTVKEMMDEERSLINDAFLVSLFQILTETPQMTATEVIERINEKGILLAPTMGRQQSEYVGPLVDRELDVLAQQGMLPPMPPRLREAQGSYQVIHTSPLARAMRAGEAAGFIRTVETAKEVVNITQDPSYLDWADFDTAMPAIAEIQGVPPSWTASDEQIAGKRKRRAEQQAVQAQIQALPAQAAMLKAQATVEKAQPGISGGAEAV